jgi:hypothetical protein
LAFELEGSDDSLLYPVSPRLQLNLEVSSEVLFDDDNDSLNDSVDLHLPEENSLDLVNANNVCELFVESDDSVDSFLLPIVRQRQEWLDFSDSSDDKSQIWQRRNHNPDTYGR